jgi:hypothetical protein
METLILEVSENEKTLFLDLAALYKTKYIFILIVFFIFYPNSKNQLNTNDLNCPYHYED